MKGKHVTLESILERKLKDPEFKAGFEEARNYLRIARLIVHLRLEAGLTQSQLAKKTDVSQPMIARVEKGDQSRVPTLATLNKILYALGYQAELVIRKVS